MLSTFIAARGQATLEGVIRDITTDKPVPFASIVVQGNGSGAISDIDGLFRLEKVTSGYLNLEISCIGYNPKTSNDIFITGDKPVFVEIFLEPSVTELDAIEIKTTGFERNSEAPLSIQKIGIKQIEKSPGGNRDISKVIQSLPGVAFSSSFRNDIIVRGGSPSENRFYLDGIEVPIINHFQTQGASGGPVGIINVDFLREAELYTGAFPVSRNNGLSSILELKQKEGNKEKMNFRVTGGSSDLAFASDGPISDNTSYTLSIRRSYLQFLFSALKLPFLPTYNDFQFKTKTRLSENSEIIFTGIGSIDDLVLNESVNDDITDPEQVELNNYILNNIPESSQWSYTIGTVFRYYKGKSVQNFILSRNELNNSSIKYSDNDESEDVLFDYNSRETETKFRFENDATVSGFRIKFGAGVDLVELRTKNFRYVTTSLGAFPLNIDSELNFLNYATFGSVSRPVFAGRLNLSVGIRMDASGYSDNTDKLAEQFSPRFSASYSISEKLDLNLSTGIYYQLPTYTALAFANSTNKQPNKNTLTYIQNTQTSAGFAYYPDKYSRISVEGFYKNYSNYPYSLTDSVSLANLGSDFGVVGSDLLTPESEGIARGLELSAQRRSASGIFGVFSYTYVISEFRGPGTGYSSSSWDNRHIISTTLGRSFSNKWDLGVRWRYLSGRPYTPYDIEKSSLKENWDVRGQGIPDFSRVNIERLEAFHQLDIRIDRNWYFKKWSLQLYLDIQNIYNFQSDEQDILNVRTDSNGDPITDPNDPSRYEVYFIEDSSGTILPSIGFILDF
jgi:hypothetical protein